MKPIGAVILAAGASTRMGKPKQLLILGTETLLDRAVRVASLVCTPVVVVLGSNADLIRSGCTLRKAIVVINEDWTQGMGTSISSGMSAIDALDGVVVMTCDMPAVTPGHLRLLMESGQMTASRYADRHGVPAYFPAACFAELRALQGEGARHLLQQAPTINLAFGEFDVDTPDDFERAKTMSL